VAEGVIGDSGVRTSDPLAVVPEVNPPVVVTKSASRRLVRDSPEVMLQPTSTDVLFALAGLTEITPAALDGAILYAPRDESLRVEPTADKGVRYEVYSTGRLAPIALPTTAPAAENPPPDEGVPPENRTLAHSIIDPQIETYARKPEVSGSNETGPLAGQRPKEALVTPLDQTIAANIEKHLQGPGFSYTLDLTDAKGIGEGRDPLTAFLTDFKRGHCEYFAGAMTLMCQSLGMQARVVVGFKCDEFNALTGSYVVRQSHAHAWVEVESRVVNDSKSVQETHKVLDRC